MADKKPIIKVWSAKPKEASFRRSEEKPKELIAKEHKKLDELDGKLTAFCDCRWSDKEWSRFEVQEFPDIETGQKFAKFLEEQIVQSNHDG